MLEINSLSVAYGSRFVLQDVTLDVQSGEVLALIGPNGAGKSTLIRAVSGVLSCRSGSIHVDGKDVTRLSYAERARRLAVVSQARQIPAGFSVYQTVLLGRTPYLNWLGQPEKTDREITLRAMQQTQVQELSERLIGQLSGGEQQRVILARALAQDTPVLLLDEPTTFLDLEHQSRILALVRRLARETGRAVLMAIHDLNWAALYADRVALLDQGRLIALGEPRSVLTGEKLGAAYRVPVQVIPHPEYGTPLVLPDGFK